MQIDWFTFVAQVINFLVLVWLLKRFLYGPILRAIDEREKTIADRLQAAADREAAAAAAQQAYKEQQAELTHLKESLLAEAAAEVDQWRKDRLQELRDEVAEARKSWYDSVAREQRQFFGELRERTARQVQEVARHVLRELADCELEQQMIQRFLAQVDSDSDGRRLLSQNGKQGSQVVIRTAFPLSPDGQTSLSEDIAGRIRAGPVRFDVDADLICGIELVTGDHKIEWNVDNYLESLQRSITSAIDQQAMMSATF